MSFLKIAFIALINLSLFQVHALQVPKGKGMIVNQELNDASVKFHFGASDGERLQLATCTGTFISSHTILTAAHCLSPGLTLVTSANKDRGTEDEIRVFSPKDFSLKMHDKYNPNKIRSIESLKAAVPHDVGLIVFKKAVHNGPTINFDAEITQKVIDIANRKRTTSLYFFGGGSRNFNLFHKDREELAYLYTLLAPVIGASARLHTHDKAIKNSIQVRSKIIDVKFCEGDSGGPLVLRASNGSFYQVGVASATSHSRMNQFLSRYRVTSCSRSLSLAPLDRKNVQWILDNAK